jgi:Circadian oscillating protein COP23
MHQGIDFVTVARRGVYQTKPIITWSDKSFGKDFSPRNRCVTVAERFNQAVSKSGYSLDSLKLTYGKIDRYPVICYIVSTAQRCNRRNLILTLKESEFGKEQAIINQLKQFSGNGQTDTLHRGGGDEDIAGFGKPIDDLFKPGNVQPATPELDVTTTEESTTP